MPLNSVKVGIDLVPIKNIQGCITIQADITTPKCLALVKREIKHVKADVVLHDGAPNVGAEWTKDAYTQSELVLSSLKLATQLLRKDGIFVTKIFRSKDYATLLTVFKKLFRRVIATKPKASRQTSAEIFVVCTGFSAPHVIEPQLLDPKFVFSENPTDVKDTVTSLKQLLEEKRHRGGYGEETTGFVYGKTTLIDFVNSVNPFQTLKGTTTLTIDEESKKMIQELPSKEDIESLCKDTKVLGKRELTLLLKWRANLLKKRAIEKTKAEEVVVAPKVEVPVNEEEEIEKFIAMRERKSEKAKKKLEKKIERHKGLRREVEFAGEDNIDEDMGFDEILSEDDDIENIGYVSLSDTDEEIEKQGFALEEPDVDNEEDARIEKMNEEMEEFHKNETEALNDRNKAKKKLRRKREEEGSEIEGEDEEDKDEDDEEDENELKVETEQKEGFVNPLKNKIAAIVKEEGLPMEEKKKKEKISQKRSKPEEDEDDDIQGLPKEKTDRDKRKEKKKRQRERLEKEGKVGKRKGFEEVKQEFIEGI